jgi:ABC-2 type transport system permease protein
MIFIIANQELRSFLREGRFRTTALLLSGLFLLSLFGAYDYYTSLKKQHTEAAQTAREQWDNQKDKNPHSAAHYGTYVFKPIYPLSYFDRGVDGFTGNTLFLEAHRSNASKFKAAEDRGAVARLGTLTPAFVLGMLFPLLIIVLGFGSAAAERENGNLRLLLAQGVKPSTLFLGKSLGLWAAVLALALPFFAAGAVGLLVASAGGEHWLRYALTMLLYLAYFGCFIHLTLLISAWSGRQNVALVGSLGVWVLICLVVPKAAVNIAKQQHPAPTWQSYNNAIKADLEKGVDGHDPADAYTEKLEKETLAKYGVDCQLTDLAGTSRRAFVASKDALDEAQQNWAGWFLKKFDADQSLTAADYEEFTKFPDRLSTASVRGANSGAFWLLVQCFLAGAWAWWSGRRRSLIFA